jgi:hypothetical protein
MVSRLRRPLDRLRRRLRPRTTGHGSTDDVLLAVGALHARAVRSLPPESNIQDAEFRIFSQWGEDGIIQFLLAHVPIADESFVEFGVAGYRESNTRFLLEHDGWSGLIMDGGTAHIDFLRERQLDWRCTIAARSTFITRDNVNDAIAVGGYTGDIGLLSVDIDGNDYWVVDALEVVRPRILIIEYNSTFGPERAVSIPYDPLFDRTIAHSSMLYWGASISALSLAAERKGYALVGSNSAGNNAFFVRRDVLGTLRQVLAQDAWRPSRFRESRAPDGTLTHVGPHSDRLRIIGELPLIDVTDGTTIRVSDLLD